VESQLGHGSTFFFTLPVFSLAQLCAPIFAEPNLKAGSVTLIAVDVIAAAVDGAVQPDILPAKLPDALPDAYPKIRRLLEHCIHPGQAVLLPSMSDADPVRTFFIVACTSASGLALTASRIDMELRSFDGAAKLRPVNFLEYAAHGARPVQGRTDKRSHGPNRRISSSARPRQGKTYRVEGKFRSFTDLVTTTYLTSNVYVCKNEVEGCAAERTSMPFQRSHPRCVLWHRAELPSQCKRQR